MSTIFYHPKRKSYYHRSIVPKRLKGLLRGREQLWRSLKTDDKEEAKVRSAQWDSRILQLFRTLRRHGERMTDEEREALVAHWLDMELDYAEDCRSLAGPVSDDDRESQLEGSTWSVWRRYAVGRPGPLPGWAPGGGAGPSVRGRLSHSPSQGTV